MVDAARTRQQKGKLGAFDAIYVNLELSRSLAIKFTSGLSLKARTIKVRNVSVFFLSKPLNEYEEVVRLPSKSGNYEENGLLQDKVKSMINRALRRVKTGDIPAFDGIIFNPDDFSATAIKFNSALSRLSPVLHCVSGQKCLKKQNLYRIIFRPGRSLKSLSY